MTVCTLRALRTPVAPRRLLDSRRAQIQARGLARGQRVEEELVDSVRELLADEEGLTEKATFGGIAFLVGGDYTYEVVHHAPAERFVMRTAR